MNLKDSGLFHLFVKGESWEIRYKKALDLLQQRKDAIKGLSIEDAEKVLGIGPNDIEDPGLTSGYYREARVKTPEERARISRQVDRTLSEVSAPPRELHRPRS